MKKLLFVMLMATTLIGCEGPMGPQGPPGDSGEPDITWYETDLTVRSNQWVEQRLPGTDGFYYTYEVPWDILDEYVVERGVVVGYILDFTGAYSTLPYVFHYNDPYEWTQTVSLSFFKGAYEIQVRTSDLDRVAPGEMSFRIIALE